MVICAENISKDFTNKKSKRKVSVVKSADIVVNSGELTVIFGRSGSGKTTLLNMLAGLLSPSEGSVMYDGKDISHMSDKELSAYRCRNIGYIPQGQSALSVLTVYEDIVLPAALTGDDVSKKAESLLDTVGLRELRNAYPSELSGGELRRLAVARALINSPRVIFADEPTNDLDDENSKQVFSLLKKCAEEGTAVVIVSHEASAEKYADRIYRMDGGTISKEKEIHHEDTQREHLVS